MAEGTSNKYKGYVYAGKGVYYDEKQRMRERYPVFKGVMEAVEEDKKVAVKVIDASAESRQEAKNILDLHHHNIVRCFTSGEFQPRGLPSIFIAMELCEPDTIFERVMNGYCTSSELKNKILFHMACGLDYLHSQPILHRDLKPQNVLFKDGDYKLADFGFSKRMSTQKSSTKQSSGRRGTDGWRAPETYDPGNSRISKKADIFSLGLIYYFVLSQGKHAFGDDEDLWNHNIKTMKRMDLSGLKCNDVALNKHLIEIMLEKNPKDRPSITDILLHPIFWNEEKKITFFQKATGYIMQTENGLVEKLNENTFDVLNGKENWSDDLLLKAEERTRVEKKLKESINADDIKQQTLYNGNGEHGTASLDSLLRFMNLCNSQEDSQRIPIILQELGGSWKFFSSRFPNLFCQVYYTIKDHIEEGQCKDSGILSYFSKSQTDYQRPISAEDVQHEPEGQAGNEQQENQTDAYINRFSREPGIELPQISEEEEVFPGSGARRKQKTAPSDNASNSRNKQDTTEESTARTIQTIDEAQTKDTPWFQQLKDLLNKREESQTVIDETGSARIFLHSCAVTFVENSLQPSSTVTLSNENFESSGGDGTPDNLIPVSSMFKCDYINDHARAEITMKLCCKISQEANLLVYYQKKGSDTWHKHTNIELKEENTNASFVLQDFSKFGCFVEQAAEQTCYLFKSFLFFKKDLGSFLHFTCISEERIERSLQMVGMEGYEDLLQAIPENISARIGEEIKFTLACDSPEGCNVTPSSISVTITQDLLRERYHRGYFRLRPIPTNEEHLDVTYAIKKQDGSVKTMPLCFKLLGPSKEDTDTIPADRHPLQNADEAMYQRHLNDPDIYQMNHGQGAAFILNNHTYGDFHLNREGSDIDAEKMTTLWKNMGCSVQQLTNCAAKSLLEALRSFSKTVNDVDYCAIILMSHGTSKDGADVIICTDQAQVGIASILDFFNNANCPQLQGIPKLFFIQSCRGDKFDSGGVKDMTDGTPAELYDNKFLPRNLPLVSDILISFSTQPNYVAFRNSKSGTWFIDSIFEVFSKHAHDTDVSSMMTTVNRLIADKTAHMPHHGAQGKQMSELKSTLRKKLFLFPGISKQKQRKKQ